MFGVGLVGSIVHVGVKHERCAAHGELVEAGPSLGLHDHGNNNLDRLDDLGAGNEGDHEHCALSLLPLAPWGGSVAIVDVSVVVVVVAHAVAAIVAADEAHIVAALVNAPKTSPPEKTRLFFVSV